jgi:uncharacterized protein (DUF302 family)
MTKSELKKIIGDKLLKSYEIDNKKTYTVYGKRIKIKNHSNDDKIEDPQEYLKIISNIDKKRIEG